MSRKITTAKRIKALRGEFITKNCAFGFKKVGNHLEIDQPAAETVRLIFELAANGHSLAKIAARLYEDKRPTPSEHKKCLPQPACIWNKPVILGILSDEQYIGTYIAGKTKRAEVGSRKTVKVPESKWIKIPGHHPAIIEKAVFDAVREKIDQKGEPLCRRKLGTSERYKDIKSPLQGKVFCGCCSHILKLSSTKNAAFHCEFTRAAPDAECYRLKFLASELEAVVMKFIREQAREILKSTNTSPLCTESTGQIAQIENAKIALYERYVLGEISAVEYKTEKTGLDAAFDRAKSIQATVSRESVDKAASENLRQMAGDALKKKKLTQEFVDAFVDRVRVFPGSLIEIVWKARENNAVASI